MPCNGCGAPTDIVGGVAGHDDIELYITGHARRHYRMIPKEIRVQLKFFQEDTYTILEDMCTIKKIHTLSIGGNDCE